MKISDGTDNGPWYDEKDEKEIFELVKNSKPDANSTLSFEKIEDTHGWTYITCKIEDSEFSINYSSCMFDTSSLIKFFAQIIDLKEVSVLVLDYEGSYPILYVAPVDNENIRFLFAHDYNLFLNHSIGEYKINDYKIECDIIINKKELLEKFYNILHPFTMNYNLEEAYEPEFNIEKGKRYLREIKEYIKKI